MKSRTFTPMGSMHPVIFFVIVYVVVVLVSIFICSSLFYSCNDNQAGGVNRETNLIEKPINTRADVWVRK